MNEQSRFESWVLDNEPCPGDDTLAKKDGAYTDETTALLWSCWQAALNPKENQS